MSFRAAKRPTPADLGFWTGRLSLARALALAVVAAGLASLGPGPLEARSERTGSATEYEPVSTLGSYLAGRVAASRNDLAAASRFFDRTLTDTPDDPSVIAAALVAAASEGKYDKADRLASQLIATQPTHREARLWLGVAAFADGKTKLAREHFSKSEAGPIAELTSQIARAWSWTAEGRFDQALSYLARSDQAEWARFYGQYHSALISDVADRPQRAFQLFRVVLQKDPRTPRTTLAYATAVAARGQQQRALRIAERYLARIGRGSDALTVDLIDRLKRGEPIKALIATPQDGLAEMLYGLGEALSNEGGATPLGIIYLRAALRLKPDFVFAIAALANVYESFHQYERANAVYDMVPEGTPLSTAIEIRKGLNLNSVDRVEDARAQLIKIIEREPDNVDAMEALASMLRARKRYEEAIVYYSRVIEQLGESKPSHWVYWYARGTCYERVKNWPKAETDLLKAMSLNPNQPLVLNYLGYSWVDQNQRLMEGLKLIKKAVALKPDDGYIVDSLGWAYYRLGNMPLAVKYLERAVELKPEDPILNDHLGDALWRSGRLTEARYQWGLALTFNPEPEEIVKIRRKLREGLPGPEVAGRAGAGGAPPPSEPSVQR